MGNCTRRQFLVKGATGLAAAVTGYTFNSGISWAFDAPLTGTSFDFRTISAGVNGGLFKGPRYNPEKKMSSTLMTEVDFKKGFIRQTQLPIMSPHAPQYLPDGRIFAGTAHVPVALFLDKDHKIIKKLVCPEGYVFGGHSLILEDLGFMAIAVKKRVSRTTADTGWIQFYDLKTLEPKHRIAAVSTFPHDMERISKDEIVLSQYGTLMFDFQPEDTPAVKDGVTYLMDVRNPTLSYIDLKKMSITRNLGLKQFHGLNHISLGPNESLYAVSVQALGKDPASVKFAIDYYKDPKITVQHSIDPSSDKFMVLPSPFTSIAANGETKNYLGTPSQQLRSQDMVSDEKSDWVASTFPSSQTIGVMKNRKLELISTVPWGVQSPRAIGLSPDKKQVVICDQDLGFIVLDRETMKRVATAFMPVFRTVHLDTAPAA